MAVGAGRRALWTGLLAFFAVAQALRCTAPGTAASRGRSARELSRAAFATRRCGDAWAAVAPEPSVSRVPRHLAVIPDGNSRWAERHGLRRDARHPSAHRVRLLRRELGTAVRGDEMDIRAGTAGPDLRSRAATRARRAVSCGPAVALYADVARTPSPPAAPRALLNITLDAPRAYQWCDASRLRFIGEIDRLPEGLRCTLRRAAAIGPVDGEESLLLCIALSYGGRHEVARIARGLAERVAAGELSPANVDEAAFAHALRSSPTSAPSDPDLLVRTGGQQRLSNFLLFQAAYTELYITDVLWPDFGADQLETALGEFARRKRTFGRRVQ
eukprot:2091198-Prymnesium_polylepis.1